VAVSSGATAAIKRDGSLWSWGANNDDDRLGAGGPTSRAVPGPAFPGTAWSQVSFGDTSCGIRTDGSLHCWGFNGFGNLGIGTTRPRAGLVAPTSGTWASVAVAWMTSVAVGTDGTLIWWGRDRNGNPRTPITLQPGSQWLSAVSDTSDIVAIRSDNSLWTTAYFDQPFSRVGSGMEWASLVQNSSSAVLCALRTRGTLACWERNGTPTDVPDPGPWRSVSLGETRCGVKTNGGLWCWGRPLGSVQDNTPMLAQVGTDTDWSEVAVGWNHICAVKSNGALWCWGSNDEGQLGDNTGWSNIPVKLAQ